MWMIWLIAGVALILAEMFTLTFYLLWLGIGALAGFVISLAAPEAYLVQVLAVCAVALVLTFFTKPLTNRLHHSKGYRDAIDELIGKQGIVVERIGENNLGIVRVGNETWSAKAEVSLEEGEPVIVLFRGTTVLEVQKWEEI